MNEPTPEQLAKLPKWAQDHIKHLTTSNNAIKSSLKQFNDSQTPSPIWVDEWLQDPRIKRYIQAPHCNVIFSHKGVDMRVMLAGEKDPSRAPGIEISYSRTGRWGDAGEIALVPKSHGLFQLISKENMR